MIIHHTAKQAGFNSIVSPKPIYLNGVQIGNAATWFDVAETIAAVAGINFTAKAWQNHASEGPQGFYVTLNL